jgi:hypothetical protein
MHILTAPVAHTMEEEDCSIVCYACPNTKLSKEMPSHPYIHFMPYEVFTSGRPNISVFEIQNDNFFQIRHFSGFHVHNRSGDLWDSSGDLWDSLDFRSSFVGLVGLRVNIRLLQILGHLLIIRENATY